MRIDSKLEISTPDQDMKAFLSATQFVFPSFPFILLTVNILMKLQLISYVLILEKGSVKYSWNFTLITLEGINDVSCS
jgi:hypothetical protein